MSKQLKVAANLPQDLTDEEKAQARANISAASASSLSSLSSTVENNTYEIAGINSKLGSMEWKKLDVDPTLAPSYDETKELFRVGNLVIGYYFYNGNITRFTIDVKSASGTRYVCLTNEAGGYMQSLEMDETVWNVIKPLSSSPNKCKYYQILGYDCTADKGFQFGVLYCTDGTTPLVCRYRILEE